MSLLVAALGSVIDSVLDLVVPRHCGGCGEPGRLLCGACRPAAPPVTVAVPDVAVTAAGVYEGGLRRALLAYKERGRAELGVALGQLLAAAVAGAAAGRSVCCLVPVPTDPRAARARGGDHALRLARVAARRTGLPMCAALTQARAVRDSAGLGRDARAANLAGALTAVIGPPGRGAQALVVDDIVTTGTTLREARRALEAAGWLAPAAAVVAATPRRGSS